MVPWDDALSLPERHLGLIQAEEIADLDAFLDAAARLVGSDVDTDGLVNLASSISVGVDDAGPALAPLGQCIAVARDAAFAFAYEHVLEGWRAVGCEVLPFSPLAGEGVPHDADAVYLPGGYPGTPWRRDGRK